MSAPTKLPAKPEPPKRFYTKAEAVACDGGWSIALDGKPIKTPKRQSLVLPFKELAEAVAAEWQAQGEHILLEQMRLNQFSCAALDYVAEFRAEVVEETAGYGETDLLCYRADEPPALVREQAEGWNRWLDWVQQNYHAPLAVTVGMMPVAQSDSSLSALKQVVDGLPLYRLTAGWLLTKHLGSLVLALAVLAGEITAEEAFALSRLDEDFQARQWGEDDEARAKREEVAIEMAALQHFLSLIKAEK